MKINAVTFLGIILTLGSFQVVVAQTTAHPKGSQSRSSKAQANRAAKPDPNAARQDDMAEAAVMKKLEAEIAALSKLSEADKQQIRGSIEELRQEITRAKLGDRLAKSTRKLAISTASNPFASLQKHLEQSVALLPPKGITAEALLQAWTALNDFLILELGAESNVVTNNSLKIIGKYELKGNSLYLMSIDVLDIALTFAGFALQLISHAR